MHLLSAIAISALLAASLASMIPYVQDTEGPSADGMTLSSFGHVTMDYDEKAIMVLYQGGEYPTYLPYTVIFEVKKGYKPETLNVSLVTEGPGTLSGPTESGGKYTCIIDGVTEDFTLVISIEKKSLFGSGSGLDPPLMIVIVLAAAGALIALCYFVLIKKK
ncbi:MAG: hypothetical protein LBI08_01380 [Methanomassiliicoccaceae archaeon]|nr:hypothetical protein [Methanomassiliicoccaceae archaeon]